MMRERGNLSQGSLSVGSTVFLGSPSDGVRLRQAGLKYVHRLDPTQHRAYSCAG